MVWHTQNATPHQYPNYVWVEEDWRNLGEVKKLLEQGNERELKPDVEVLLTKNNGIGLLLGWHWVTTQKTNQNANRSTKALPELPYIKLFNRLPRLCSSNNFSWSNILLVLTSRIGRSVTPSRCHSNMVGRVEPAQHKDRILKSSHPTLLFSKQCLRCIKANLHLFKACNRAEPELNL